MYFCRENYSPKHKYHMGKFTKEQAVESITAKFADKAKGIDLVRTIDEAVSNGMAMIGENSEMELDAFTAFVEKNVSSALGLARHLKTTATSEIQQQLDALKLKLEGKETPKPKPDEIKSDDPAIQAILDKMSQLEQKEQQREKEKAVSEKRSQLVAKMKESIKDEEWINSYLAEISITDQTDVDAKAKDYIAFYNRTQSKGGHITPKSTDGGGSEDSYVKSTVAAAAQFKKQTTAGGPVQSKTVTNN